MSKRKSKMRKPPEPAARLRPEGPRRRFRNGSIRHRLSTIPPRKKTHLHYAGWKTGGHSVRPLPSSFGTGASHPVPMIKKPVTVIGRTIGRRAVERMTSGCAADLDLMSIDDSVAYGAEPFIIERIPAPVIIDGLEDLEPFVGADGSLHVSH